MARSRGNVNANMTRCTATTTRYARPKASPSAPNAFGAAIAMTRNPPMATSSITRLVTVEVPVLLVTQL